MRADTITWASIIYGLTANAIKRANTQKQVNTITLIWAYTILQAITITQDNTIISLNCEHPHTGLHHNMGPPPFPQRGKLVLFPAAKNNILVRITESSSNVL